MKQLQITINLDDMNRDIGYMTANPKAYNAIKEYKIELKTHQTNAELILWKFLRGKAIGHKIRRQHIIDNFIADFICLPQKLIIEIDGEIHSQQIEYDEGRTARLSELGFDVIRFKNEDIFTDIESVVNKIKHVLDEKS